MQKFTKDRMADGTVKRRRVIYRSSGRKDPLEIGPTSGGQIYRCPGCREIVDNQNIDEILLHREHALYPHRFGFALEPPNNSGE